MAQGHKELKQGRKRTMTDGKRAERTAIKLIVLGQKEMLQV
jgi:hypothetical protein